MTLAEGIERFFVDHLRQFEGEPRLYLRVNREMQTVDWLAADDLAKGFEDELPETERERALSLLKRLVDVLGTNAGEAEVFRRRLKVQDSLSSCMGHHVCIIMREKGLEYPGFFFVVHLDRQKRVYMINCVYEPGVVTAVGVPFSPAAAAEVETSDARRQLGVGCVYGAYWAEDLTPDIMAENCTEVVLRDVEEVSGRLAGRYVEVTDDVNTSWDSRLDKDHWCIKASIEEKTSHFDRVAAYYHTERIQRYFRTTLGLNILDRYKSFNPLHVCLTKQERIDRSRYDTKEERAYFRRIDSSKAYQWTDARDARWIYHEYVHAVTHTIAQFRRPTREELQRANAFQMIQACAMDEGLADYFACSLAEQQGAEMAEFGQILQSDETKAFVWKTLRRLSSDQPPCSNDLGTIREAPLRIKEEWDVSNESPEKLYYRWGECWGRFLWQLRGKDKLGVEVADMLVAHSLFFLTRRSDFGAGVWALIMADRRLFNGTHEHIIRELAQVDTGKVGEQGEINQVLAEHDDVELAFGVMNGAATDSLDLGEMWNSHQMQIRKQPYLD